MILWVRFQSIDDRCPLKKMVMIVPSDPFIIARHIYALLKKWTAFQITVLLGVYYVILIMVFDKSAATAFIYRFSFADFFNKRIILTDIAFEQANRSLALMPFRWVVVRSVHITLKFGEQLHFFKRGRITVDEMDDTYVNLRNVKAGIDL